MDFIVQNYLYNMLSNIEHLVSCSVSRAGLVAFESRDRQRLTLQRETDPAQLLGSLPRYFSVKPLSLSPRPYKFAASWRQRGKMARGEFLHQSRQAHEIHGH